MLNTLIRITRPRTLGDPEIDEARRRRRSARRGPAAAAACRIPPRPWPRCRVRTRSASASRPWRASQRGLSGRPKRRKPTSAAAARADQHHPAPAVEAERRQRHEFIGEERDHRHAAEADRLRAGERPAAQTFRRHLAQVGADRHHLDAKPDPRDQAPDVEAEGVGLQRDDHVGGRVPEQRTDEDGAPPVAVGEKAAGERADEQAGEQRGDEAGDAGKAEEARGRRQPAARSSPGSARYRR